MPDKNHATRQRSFWHGGYTRARNLSGDKDIASKWEHRRKGESHQNRPVFRRLHQTSLQVVQDQRDAEAAVRITLASKVGLRRDGVLDVVGLAPVRIALASKVGLTAPEGHRIRAWRFNARSASPNLRSPKGRGNSAGLQAATAAGCRHREPPASLRDL